MPLVKIFTTALSISTVSTFSPANDGMLRRFIAHSKQVGINIGINHAVLNALRRSETDFLTLIEGLNEVRGLKTRF